MNSFHEENCFDAVFNIKIDEAGKYVVPPSSEYIEILRGCRLVDLTKVCVALGTKTKGRKEDIVKKIDFIIQKSGTNILESGLFSLCFVIRALMTAVLGEKRQETNTFDTLIPSFKDLKHLIGALQHTAPMKVIIFLASVYSNMNERVFKIENVTLYSNLTFLEEAKVHHLRIIQNNYFYNHAKDIPKYHGIKADNEAFLFSMINSLNHIHTNISVPLSNYREPLPKLQIDPNINIFKYRYTPAQLTEQDKQFMRQHRSGDYDQDQTALARLANPHAASSIVQSRPAQSSGPSPDTKKMMDEYKFIQSYFFNNTKLLKQGILPKTGYKTTTLIKFHLTEPDIQRLKNVTPGKGYSYQVLLYCGSFTNTIQPREFIKFPSPIELKINNVHITDYIRGIKDKPATAQAARLTEHLILDTEKENVVQITFIRTLTPFICKAYLVKSFDGLQLFKKSIAIKEHIPKNVTISKVKEILQEDDDELQMETMKMSLQCPISYMRMKNPVRSITCHHIQCFDAQWFLEAQKQVPLWECPVCQKNVDIMDLRLCDYTLEILNNCKNDYDDQVEITKDGNYKYIEGVKDESESDEGEMAGSKSNTADNYNFQTARKNELEPEVINLISDDEVEENSVPILPQLSVAPPLSIPVLATAESEEHVGNIADDDEEEMPSLRNDGRDLTMTLARHHFSPESTSQITKAGTSNESSGPISGALPQKRRASSQQQADDFVDLTSD